MKVKIESGRCDFCQVNEPKHTINGGLWWICTPCMDLEFAESVAECEFEEESPGEEE